MPHTMLAGSSDAPLQLADFGFSKDANQHSAPTSRVGTPAYLAPEVITNQPGQVYDGKVRTATGMWRSNACRQLAIAC